MERKSQITQEAKIMQNFKGLNRATLLISCLDQPGIVAAVSRFLFEHNANIVHSDQYSTDPEGGMFFMRIEFDLEDFDTSFPQIKQGMEQIARDFGMDWKLADQKTKKRMAILLSKEEHCLMELLFRHKMGELYVDIPMVISNHMDAKETVDSYGIPFHYVSSRQPKQEAEKQIYEILGDDIDFIVLARYMQILSPDFVAKYRNRAINIHHSFLPAFIGANPYKRAYERGVKLIGATAHYVTDDLDEGPIIEQEVMRVNHRYTTEDLKVTGRIAERIALARAVSWHIDDRILVHGNKTVVF